MNNIKVLIVEDEVLIIKAIKIFLEKSGFEVKEATTEKEVFNILNNFMPDIILMDIMLHNSEKNGIEIAKEILKKEDIPIIFVTAYTDKEIIEQVKSISPYGYLVKPIDNKNLLILIELSLQKHKYEKIIREKEKWFSKSLQSITDGFIATDIDGNIKFINKTALSLTGYTEEEISNKKVNDILKFLSIEKLSKESKLYNSKYVQILLKNPKIVKNIKIMISKEKKIRLIAIKKEDILENNKKYGSVYLLKDLTKQICLNLELAIKNQQFKKLNKMMEQEINKKIKTIIEEKKALEIRNEFIENELILARKIQMNMMPVNSGHPNIHFLYHPVDKVGGDFFDFVKFREEELIGIFLCDVSGHGLSSAFLTTMIKNMILEAGKNKLNPTDLLYYLNEQMIDKTGGHFITAIYGIYNKITKNFIYSNAGHTTPFLIKKDGITKLEFKSFCLPLGIFSKNEHEKKGISYQNYEIKIGENEKILLYTDGIIEIKKKSNNITIEYNTILEILNKYKNEENSDLILNNIFSELVNFREDKNFDDDITMIIID